MLKFLSETYSRCCPNRNTNFAPKANIAYGQALLAKNNLSSTLLQMPNVVSVSVHQQPNNPSSYFVKVGVISSLSSVLRQIPSEYHIQSGEDLKTASVPIVTEITGKIEVQ